MSRTKYPSTLYVTISNVTDKAVLSTLYVDQIAAQNPALSQYIEHVVSETSAPKEKVRFCGNLVISLLDFGSIGRR